MKRMRLPIGFFLAAAAGSLLMGQGRLQSWVDAKPLIIDSGRAAFGIFDANVPNPPGIRWVPFLQREDVGGSGWGGLLLVQSQSKVLRVMATKDGEQWSFAGEMEGPQIRAIAGLGPNSVLLLAGRGPFCLESGISDLAVATRKEGTSTFSIHHLVMLDRESTMIRFAYPGPDIDPSDPDLFTFNEHNQGLGLEVRHGCHLVSLRSGVAVVAPYAGRIWVLNARGEIQRSFDVLKALGLDADPSKTFRGKAILAAFPASDGKLVVVSRNRPWANRKSQAVVERSNGSVTKDERPLLWWLADPAEENLERLASPPPGGPSDLPPDFEGLVEWVREFPFVIGSNGNLFLVGVDGS